LIQVINWEKYQASVTVAKSATPTTRNNGSVSKSDTERDTQADTERDTQADTERDTERIMYKNGKNEKNPDLTSLPFPSKKFQECWRDWETHRKEIKKPLTPTAIKQQHKQMAEWGEAWSIRVMRHTMAQGWQGLREPDGEKRPTNNASRVATAEDLANWRPEAIYD
ncbi:MAG: hypothetical protein KDA87_24855, partial [Planctomycetales bacterium]|nr:hypothetical protein [Planctomycetales bacterium]